VIICSTVSWRFLAHGLQELADKLDLALAQDDARLELEHEEARVQHALGVADKLAARVEAAAQHRGLHCQLGKQALAQGDLGVCAGEALEDEDHLARVLEALVDLAHARGMQQEAHDKLLHRGVCVCGDERVEPLAVRGPRGWTR
jgi:hypothetical protein